MLLSISSFTSPSPELTLKNRNAGPLLILEEFLTIRDGIVILKWSQILFSGRFILKRQSTNHNVTSNDKVVSNFNKKLRCRDSVILSFSPREASISTYARVL